MESTCQDALLKIQYGVYIITSRGDGKINGQIATVVFQVTSHPPQLAIAISKDTLTHDYIEKSQCWGISLLEQEAPMAFIGRFGFRSGRDFNKFDGILYKTNQTGCPLVIDYSLMLLEAHVKQKLDLTTHDLYIGELVGSEMIKEGTALTYEYYHRVKRGKSPKNAPTYCEP